MKLKFLQSTYVGELKKTVHTGEEHVIEDVKVAESLIKAEFAKLAEEVKDEVKKRAPRQSQPKTEDGE